MHKTVALAKAFVPAIAAASSRTITRRAVPHFERKDVETGKWFLVTTALQTTRKRLVDTNKSTLELAYQIAMPKATAVEPEPINNMTAIDAAMDEVGRMHAFFMEGSSFIENTWENHVFHSAENNPLYHQRVLVDHQIFLSILRLEFFEES